MTLVKRLVSMAKHIGHSVNVFTDSGWSANPALVCGFNSTYNPILLTKFSHRYILLKLMGTTVESGFWQPWQQLSVAMILLV